ncbi:S-adenosyl-L-methionine-dependent methyltransferase [Ceratobasidium sp. AG-I]|nr:S-adenosyl-L-methionine-dependent methyltransferase [Ceratobasidium sp. AG-I]
MADTTTNATETNRPTPHSHTHSHDHHDHGHHGHAHQPHSHSHGGSSSLIDANREHFDSQAHAHGYEASPVNQLLAKKCSEAILEAYPFDEDKTVMMDYACGIGLLSQALAPHTKTLIGVDISPKSVDYYNERVANQGIPEEEMKAICVELTERGTGEADVFGGVEFDVIVCTLAYHHFEDASEVTKMLTSYLKPGTGTLLVVDLIRSSDSESLHKAHGHAVAHKGGFSQESIRAAFVDAAGLQNFSITTAFQMAQDEKSVDLFIAKGVRSSN